MSLLIEAVGMPPASTMNKLVEVISTHKPGDTIRMVVYRGNAKKTIEVKLGRQPSSP